MTKIFKVRKKTSVGASKKPTFLEGVKVLDATGQEVVISDLWQNETIVLKILRRLGCPICRYESRLLSELKSEFSDLGARLVAITFEDIGISEFIGGGYWDWDILVDKERNLHNILELKSLSVSEGLKDITSSSARSAIFAAKKAGISGDLSGDGLQLGGTFVIERGTGHILYEHKQTHAGSYASVKELYESIGGDPQDVEEKAPVECLTYVNPAELKFGCST